ncbi:MAG TPA: hypothetical protein VFN55_10010 [Solirubrobacteraceae bacterium]|nr:hypothetical protein [Solirubrobacteraceae bacterium]
MSAWVQSARDGTCPSQQPESAPSDAWGLSSSDGAVTPGAPFSQTWKADSSYVALGAYYVCAWVADDRFNTVAAAQAPLTIRPPVLRLSVSVPRHARVGARGTFAVTASLETPSQLGVVLLPPRAYVCDLSGTVCTPRRLTGCPTSYIRAENLASSIQADVTPFLGANFADNREYHGRVRFRARLKALSAGWFHFCAYAREAPLDAPGALTEARVATAFRVAG